MASGKGKVTLRGRFADGVEVGVYLRRGDTFNVVGLGEKLDEAKPSKGEVTFTGLEAGETYWAVQHVNGEIAPRNVAFTAKHESAYREPPRSKLTDVDRQVAAQSQPAPHPGHVVVGARGTLSARARSEKVAEQVVKATAIPEAHERTKGGPVREPHPRIKQADTTGPQRSDTPLGEGHPVDRDEIQPKIPQSEVPKGTLQRSDTPLGEATPVSADEVQPAVRQEDTPKGLEQRSDTATGQAEPLPEVGAKESAKRRSSSESTARGATKGQAARSRPKRPTGRARKASTRRRSQARTRSATEKEA